MTSQEESLTAEDKAQATAQAATLKASDKPRQAPSGEGQRPAPKAPSGISEADRRDLEERMAEMPEDPRPMFTFVSPKAEKAKFLIQRGELPPGETNELKREDIWASFKGGICQSRDPIVGDWLEAHSTNEAVLHAKYHDDQEEYDLLQPTSCAQFAFCKSADDPHVAAWADIEYRKLQKINEERSLPADYDYEKLLAGENPTNQASMSGVPAVRTR